MGKINDLLIYKEREKKYRKIMEPFQEEVAAAVTEFEKTEKELSIKEEKFISEKIYSNMPDDYKKKVKEYREMRKRCEPPKSVTTWASISTDDEITTGYPYSFANYCTETFDPDYDSWHIIDIERNKDNQIRITVSATKNEGSISGLLTMFNTTFNTGWFDIKEIENL